MMEKLLDSLRYKSEGTDIDFKSAQYRFIGGSEDDKSELLKDILAIANSWRDGPGYILIGFKDQRPHPAEVIGINQKIDDAQIQQFINRKVSPKLTFKYEEHLYQGKTVGVIHIPVQNGRPFYISHPYGKLKSNVVYIRRGSSTDEAAPPEIAAMSQADSAQRTGNAELNLVSPDNSSLPEKFDRTFLLVTEKFPDFSSSHEGDFHAIRAIVNHDNRDYWRELADYIRIELAKIQVIFVLDNRSQTQISNTKMELIVEGLDGQTFELKEGRELPERPKRTYNTMSGGKRWSMPSFHGPHDRALVVKNDAGRLYVEIKYGMLLPGEQARPLDFLTIIPSGAGRMVLKFRILASELKEPLVIEKAISVDGAVREVNFESFRKSLRQARQRDLSD